MATKKTTKVIKMCFTLILGSKVLWDLFTHNEKTSCQPLLSDKMTCWATCESVLRT